MFIPFFGGGFSKYYNDIRYNRDLCLSRYWQSAPHQHTLFLRVAVVNEDFNEHCVVHYVTAFLQFTKGTKTWTSTCNVHVSWRPLKRRTPRIRHEGVRHVFYIVLIQQHKRDFLSEGPAKQCVIFSTHYAKKERNMRFTPQTITIEINSRAHLVAILTSVEVRA